MTWIKTNFMWMMYRSNWAQSKGQEYILGIWVTRDGFHELLSLAQPSVVRGSKASPDGQKVVVQWDPDHSPKGGKLERRAIQIGIKNVKDWSFGKIIRGIVNMTPFVQEQFKNNVEHSETFEDLLSPKERVYIIPNDVELDPYVRPDESM